MPSDRSRLALFDIRDNARLARTFTAGMSEDEFEAGRKTFYAVTRCLEIVSEACRRLDPALRDRHPHLPWRAIMGVGNIYRHDYGNVAEAFVWRTVRHNLEAPLEAIESQIAGLNPGP